MLGHDRAMAAAVRLAAQVHERVPGVAVSVEETTVTLSGRGLWRRWLADPGLRWLGGLLR
ncbi:hypothetical protein [Sphingomonas azotifigens]|uniref:hypothetical protein n=1 Tax=Sphingomonas azotifigens TaxID=330920 RepID=UPI001FEB3D02|nr:hypothetical protein [Sphingomonas azotifigens]